MNFQILASTPMDGEQMLLIMLTSTTVETKCGM